MSSNSTMTHESAAPGATNKILWGLQILLGAAFLFFAGGKLFGVPMMVQEFSAIGLGQWFRYFTGAVELAGAVLILTPKWSAIGGALIAATMLGAIITRFTVLGGVPVLEFVLMLMAATVAWKRRAALMR